MAVKQVFRCQFCNGTPDAVTQTALEGQVAERVFGTYLDVLPGRWLVWNGGGPLGPRRYACSEHRGDLTAYLRYHYATVGYQVWKRPPYEQRWPGEPAGNTGGTVGIERWGHRGARLNHGGGTAPRPAKEDEEALLRDLEDQFREELGGDAAL